MSGRLYRTEGCCLEKAFEDDCEATHWEADDDYGAPVNKLYLLSQ